MSDIVCRMAPNTSPVPIRLVRIRRGLVGERQRVIHVVPATRVDGDAMTAYCDEKLDAADVEQLPGVAGMPCEACLVVAPLPQAGALTA